METSFFDAFSLKLGLGEAACLAIASVRGGALFTDDKDARRVCQRRGIPVSGTVGVLVILIDRGKLSLAEANQLLREMIEKCFYSPVDTLDDLV